MRRYSDLTTTPLTLALHSSSSAQAISKFMMPAMSPTMTEGGIASWKVKDGDKFSAGDVLLEIVSRLTGLKVEFTKLTTVQPVFFLLGNGQGNNGCRSTRRRNYGQDSGELCVCIRTFFNQIS